jgi:hypothetical protein
MSNLREQSIPAEDLSDLGTPAARGAGLGDLLATPARPEADPAPPPHDAAGPYPPEVARSSRAATAVPRARSTRSQGQRTRTKPTSAVYVSQGVKQRFEDFRHKNKKTNLQVVLEAITSIHDQLGDVIKASAVSTAPVGGSLFPTDPSAVRYLGGGSVQIGFSPTPEQEAVLDQIGADLGFATRSTWIAPALNAFLPGRKDA